jgi:RHH-type proline utilization regulon transcriptional repressor/proline dehydrogenase/delta 1-pyrroline-5-carboxylate dehydrogenase
VREVAARIAELGSGTKTRTFRITPGAEWLMRRAMGNAELRTQLFRFVDALPAMADDDDLHRHVEEYFGGEVLPRGLSRALAQSGRVPGGRKVVAAVARREVARMATQFIVATDAPSTARKLETLWRRGSAATVDLLGEHTHSHAEADRYAARLADLIAVLIESSRAWPINDLLEQDDLGTLARVAVAIKPTALAPDFSSLTADAGVASAARRLTPILEGAAADGAQVWFDLERYEVKHLTHRLARELLARRELVGLQAGIVVQAYLRDSFEDLMALCEWGADREVPLAIRLVKGAYWDTETVVAQAASWPVPVYENKAETDANYERCVRLLHSYHGRVRAGFGSHNLRSLAYAIAAGRAAGIPDHGYEVQLLWGMAEPVHEAFRRLGFRLRVYAPMGELVPGMAYLVRRLLENTSNEGFVRLRFAEHKDLEALVVPPVADLDAVPAGVLAPAVVGRAATKARDPRPYEPEPLVRWFAPEAPSLMSAAIDAVRAGLGAAIPGLIGDSDLHTNRTIVSVDPADPARVVAVSACCGPPEGDAAVEIAGAAFERWSRAGFTERAGVLFRAADWLRRRRLEVASLEVFEAGKCWDDADGDVAEAIDYLEYYGREGLRLAGGGAVQSPPGEANRLSYHGRGVAVVIAPWNFPLAIPTGMTSAALVAGNTVVLKPAEQTPAVAALLVRALREGGLPDGVISFLPGLGEELGAHLVNHPGVSLVAFTGSKQVGLAIVESAARTSTGQREVRRVIAEMGGKNAIVIDSDADLDEAVPAAVRSVFGFAGQRCSAASRIVTVGAVHDLFVERFVESARALSIGPPSEMGTELGPVIDDDSVKRIRGWQDRAGQFGRVVLQREDLPPSGYFVGPTIVDDAAPGSPLVTEEIFGPVAAVLRARDFEHALELANQTDFALTAGVISRSPSRIEQASAQLRGGNIYVNRAITGAVVGRQPFGGHGMSGIGSKAGGPDYLLQFVRPRVVTENTLRQGFAPAAEREAVAGGRSPKKSPARRRRNPKP